jgi:Domain of unknown function (DUF6089)
MKKTTSLFKTGLLAGAFALLPQLSKAQYFWDYGITTGAVNYLGDMGGKELSRRDFVSDMKMSQTHLTAGIFGRYKINPYFSVKAAANWARISGDDKLSSNPGRNARNLSFRNDLIELYAQGQFFYYTINDLGHTYRNKNNFRAYFGLGLGTVFHNPKAYYQGVWIPLRGLQTEGQKYTKASLIVPASAGFYVTLNKHYRIGWDLTWRTTFTDYLDDVSTTYADPSQLPSALSIELANRTDELPALSPAFAENFTPGNKRGDSRHNDSYLSSNIDLSYVIIGYGGHDRRRYPWIHDRPPRYSPSSKHKHRTILTRKVRIHF